MSKQLTIIETFVGAGGALLGFEKAGFESILVNDIDKDTLATLQNNNIVDNTTCLHCAIEDITETMIHEKIGNTKPDVLFGGIVCKGFSLAGVRNPFDPRNYLYKHQLRLVEYLQPKVSVIENVTALKTMYLYKENSHTKTIFEEYSKLSDENKKLNGEKSSKRKNNIDYSDLSECIKINKIKMQKLLAEVETYKYNVLKDIVSIYEKMNYKVYDKILQTDDYGGFTNRKRIIIVAVRKDIQKEYIFPSKATKRCTINDAFKLIDYSKDDPDNVPMKHNEKTIRRFKYIPEGKNVADIVDKLPEDLKISSFYSRGNTQRLDRNKPAPTLVPGHSNFPIHPWEHRQITVREAATITGFPVDYKFYGSHSSRCVQIGNAVPVQLAYSIALSIKNLLIQN